MFPVGRSEAEQKFWQTPELVQGLLPFLDLESTLRLAQVHEMTRCILQGTRVWNNLIKRSSPLNERGKTVCNCNNLEYERDLLDFDLPPLCKLACDKMCKLSHCARCYLYLCAMGKVKHLVAILKLSNDTKDSMLDLLDTICESNPGFGFVSVQMGCPRHPDSHSVS